MMLESIFPALQTTAPNIVLVACDIAHLIQPSTRFLGNRRFRGMDDGFQLV